LRQQKKENDRFISRLQDRIALSMSLGSPKKRTDPDKLVLEAASSSALATPLALVERKLHAARLRQKHLQMRDLSRMDVGEQEGGRVVHAFIFAQLLLHLLRVLICVFSWLLMLVATVVNALLRLSARLDVDVSVVAQMAAAEGGILLEDPRDILARLHILQQASAGCARVC
jgi:hypothetical protein